MNTGGKQGANGVSAPATLSTQGTPGTPNITSSSPANGTYSPSTVTWRWSTASASPGGSANLTYEVSYNGGSWQNVGTATRHDLNNRGTGDHTLRVRATNKSGNGSPSAGETVRLADEPAPPTPPSASLCRDIGGAGDPLGNGYNADMFGIRWSNQSGGTHTMRVGSPGNSFNDTRTRTGSSGQQMMQSWAYSGGATNANTRYWAIFDGVAYPDQRMASIPSC